jgi:hypothetical protein
MERSCASVRPLTGSREIENAGAPGLANAVPPELSLYPLKKGEQCLRFKIAFNHYRSIGKLALGRPERAAADNRRKRQNLQIAFLQPRNRRIKHCARRTIARMAHIGAQTDEITRAQMSSVNRV